MPRQQEHLRLLELTGNPRNCTWVCFSGSAHWYFTFRSVLLGLSLDQKNHDEKACLCILTRVCICLQLQVSLSSRMLKVGTDHRHDLCVVWVMQQKSNLG